MKRRTALSVALVCLAGLVLSCPARGAVRYRVWSRPRWEWPPPRRAPRPPAAPRVTNQEPAEITTRFRDLPLKSKFYMATDRNQSFPKVKVSASEARDASKSGALGALNGPIPEDTLVVFKKSDQPAKPKSPPKKATKN